MGSAGTMRMTAGTALTHATSERARRRRTTRSRGMVPTAAPGSFRWVCGGTAGRWEYSGGGTGGAEAGCDLRVGTPCSRGSGPCGSIEMDSWAHFAG